MHPFNRNNNRLALVCSLVSAMIMSAEPLSVSANEAAKAEILTKQLELGDAVWLNDGQNKFLAIFTPDQSSHPKGGTIILHDANGHPDWPEVIKPLRRYLPLHGWATITIQLPQLDKISEYISQQPLINTRIQKATEYLHSQGLHNLALIGHGSGAMAATAFLANQSGDSGIRGFIGISLSVIKTEKREDYLPSQLEEIKIPILDIYGSLDLDSVTTTAMMRSLAAKRSSNNSSDKDLEAYKKSGLSKTANDSVKGYISYRQISIEGADHTFTAQNDTLSRRVLGWLERHTNGTAITTTR